MTCSQALRIAVANFHKKYRNMPGPLAQFKPQLASLMMGSEGTALECEPLVKVESHRHDTSPVTQLNVIDLKAHDDVVINEQGCQQSTMKWLMKWLNEEIDSINPK
jgi:hypothetical protein